VGWAPVQCVNVIIARAERGEAILSVPWRELSNPISRPSCT